MDRIFIAGMDSVAGANMACAYSDRFQVTGCALNAPVHIDGTRYDVASATPHTLISRAGVQQVVYCGLASRSSWMTDHAVIEAEERRRVRTWSRAAAAAGISFTYISSDGIFSGPWLYHDEKSDAFATTTVAKALATLEDEVREAHTDALIVRTNCFGWSPDGDQLVESILSQIESGARQFPYRHHATIIHAAELAELITRAWSGAVTGILHIGGGQRTNQNQLAQSLAAEFGLQLNHSPCGPVRELSRPAIESSFRCERLKSVLGGSLPDLTQSVTRLREEHESVFIRRFQQRTVAARVA